MTYIIGQILGIIAIILGFVSYQVKTQRQILFVQTLTAAVFVAHYLLIGAMTAMAMNAVCIVRNFAYDVRNRKGWNSLAIPIAFTVLQAIIGIITWQAWYSIFVFCGICINTFCMSFRDPQKVRASIIVTSPMVLTYDVFSQSIGGIVYEAVAIISAIIGFLRNRKKKNP